MNRRKVVRELDMNRMLNYHPTDYLLVTPKGKKPNFPMRDHAVTTTKLTDQF